MIIINIIDNGIVVGNASSLDVEYKAPYATICGAPYEITLPHKTVSGYIHDLNIVPAYINDIFMGGAIEPYNQNHRFDIAILDGDKETIIKNVQITTVWRQSSTCHAKFHAEAIHVENTPPITTYSVRDTYSARAEYEALQDEGVIKLSTKTEVICMDKVVGEAMGVGLTFIPQATIRPMTKIIGSCTTIKFDKTSINNIFTHGLISKATQNWLFDIRITEYFAKHGRPITIVSDIEEVQVTNPQAPLDGLVTGRQTPSHICGAIEWEAQIIKHAKYKR